MRGGSGLALRRADVLLGRDHRHVGGLLGEVVKGADGHLAEIRLGVDPGNGRRDCLHRRVRTKQSDEVH